MELGGLDKSHILKVTRKVSYNEKETECSVREKQRQLESLTKINKTTLEELDKFSSFDSIDSDGFDAEVAKVEPDSTLATSKLNLIQP